MALIGNLKEFSLVNLIQLNCLENKTAKLTFNYRGKIGVIYFENGGIPHAQFDNSTGPDAIYRVIHLSEGEFKIEDGIRTNLKTNDTKWSELILEGMRIYDESQAGQEQAHGAVVRNLMQIDGVLAAIVLKRDGSPLAQSDFEEVDLYSAALAFLLSKTEALGRHAGVGHFQQAVVTFADKALVMVEQDPELFGVFCQDAAAARRAEAQITREITTFASGRV